MRWEFADARYARSVVGSKPSSSAWASPASIASATVRCPTETFPRLASVINDASATSASRAVPVKLVDFFCRFCVSGSGATSTLSSHVPGRHPLPLLPSPRPPVSRIGETPVKGGEPERRIELRTCCLQDSCSAN